MGQMIGRIVLTLLLPLLCMQTWAQNSEELPENEPASLQLILNQLASRSFDDKEAAIVALNQQPHPRVVALFQAMLNRGLVHHRDSDTVVLGIQQGGGWQLLDPLDETPLQQVGRRDAAPIVINNRLRTVINTQLAVRNLQSNDVSLRRRAAQQMIGNADLEIRTALRELRSREENLGVQRLLDTALHIAALEHSDADVRLQAIENLSGNLHSPARNALRDRLAILEDGPALASEKQALERSLAAIDARQKRYQHADTLFFGLSMGSVLLLAAIGLAITFGVMGVINMAHGELIMLGAYTTFMVQQLLPNSHEWSLLVAIPAAFLVSATVGIIIERFVIRYLYGRPLETLLATFGISLILQQAVRLIFSPLNRTVITPDWMSGSWQINPAFAITYNRLYVVIFSIMVFVTLLLILKKTRLGLQVRAVSQNRNTARALGIRSERINALTFGLGSGVAGIAGVALAQLTNVGPNLGQAYIIDSFMVVVFGGVGNLWGTFTAAFSLGIASKLLEPMTGAVLAKIIMLVFIILFIQRRPKGLFPQRGRAAEE